MGSVVAILPLMIVFLYLQHLWQESLSLGSLKGKENVLWNLRRSQRS